MRRAFRSTRFDNEISASALDAVGDLQAANRLELRRRHAGTAHDALALHPRWRRDDRDRAVLHDSGAQIAHSPSSNLFLGSGLFDWQAAVQAEVNVSVATDVGGGTSLSMQRTLADAYKVQALAGQRLTAWKALHSATLGAAEALGLADEIGALESGCTADVCVWHWASGPLAQHRDTLTRDLHERVFAWLTLSDERNLVATYVAGVPRHAAAA